MCSWLEEVGQTRKWFGLNFRLSVAEWNMTGVIVKGQQGVPLHTRYVHCGRITTHTAMRLPRAIHTPSTQLMGGRSSIKGEHIPAIISSISLSGSLLGICRYFAGVSRYPFVDVALVVAWQGSGLEGTQPRLRAKGTGGESEYGVDANVRRWGGRGIWVDMRDG